MNENYVSCAGPKGESQAWDRSASGHNHCTQFFCRQLRRCDQRPSWCPGGAHIWLPKCSWSSWITGPKCRLHSKLWPGNSRDTQYLVPCVLSRSICMNMHGLGLHWFAAMCRPPLQVSLVATFVLESPFHLVNIYQFYVGKWKRMIVTAWAIWGQIV